MYHKIVSIVIPVYNAQNYIADTIKSVLNQKYENWELIIVDDGSTDQSVKIVQDFANLDHRIKIFSKPNGGASSAKQEGLKHVNGSFVQYLDADDILADDKLSIQVAELKINPNKVAICKTAHFFDGENHFENNIHDSDHFFASNLVDDPVRFLINLYGGFTGQGGMIQPNAFLIPIEIINKTGAWNTSFSPCPDEDGEYFCRIILSSAGIVYNKKPMNFYRKFKNSKSLSGGKSERATENLFISETIKFQHLLTAVTEHSLVRKIHTAYYKSLLELEKRAYPSNKNLSKKISSIRKTLKPDLVQKRHSYGGIIANLIGNNISWKLVRILQHYKSKLSD